jgi:hypothetical protein
MAACRIAGVEPRFTSLNGHDPIAYILSANVNRRNLNAGQRAMAVVCMNSFVTNEFGAKQDLADRHDLTRTRVSKAATVHEYAPELTSVVLAGTEPLNAAYEYAKQRKEEQESRADIQARMERDLAALRRNAPELADLVDEERMALREACRDYP